MRAAIIGPLCMVGALAVAAGCNPRPVEPVALYWTTDRAVDRLDIEHMGRSLRARGRTDEQRALAVWSYVRRTMYHYPMRNENHADQFDAAKLINVYGYSFCTQQGIAAAALARAAGLKSRSIGIPGHGMYEVHYDGRWHAFCTEFAFFVRTRAPDRHIASMAEMKADPTLITKAREELRVSDPYLPCAGGPPILKEKEGTEACPYSLTCRYYDEKFFVSGVKKWCSQGAANPSKYSAWMRLRRGESLRLDWGASGRFVPPSHDPGLLSRRFWPPRHICGEKDRANPFFEELVPYARNFKGRRTYRYYGSGVQVWKPRLSARDALRDLARAEDITVRRGALRPVSSPRPALAEFEMTGPCAYVGGTVIGKTRLAKGASLKLFCQGMYADAPWKEIYSAAAGRRRFSLNLGDLVLPPEPTDPARRKEFTRYRFRLRVEITGDAELADLEIRAEVQHNWAALPQLLPGKNTVRVRTRRPGEKAAVLKGAKLLFELAWEEAGRPRKLRRRLAGPAESFTVNVRGRDIPRMRYALLARE